MASAFPTALAAALLLAACGGAEGGEVSSDAGGPDVAGITEPGFAAEATDTDGLCASVDEILAGACTPPADGAAPPETVPVDQRRPDAPTAAAAADTTGMPTGATDPATAGGLGGGSPSGFSDPGTSADLAVTENGDVLRVGGRGASTPGNGTSSSTTTIYDPDLVDDPNGVRLGFGFGSPGTRTTTTTSTTTTTIALVSP